MAGVAKELNFKFYSILINLNLNGHMWYGSTLYSTDLEPQVEHKIVVTKTSVSWVSLTDISAVIIYSYGIQ